MYYSLASGQIINFNKFGPSKLSSSSSIPIYTLLYLLLPSKLLDDLNKVVRAFWWVHEEHISKTHRISWNKICHPKFVEGLGVRDFEWLNLALLAKLAWRICT